MFKNKLKIAKIMITALSIICIGNSVAYASVCNGECSCSINPSPCSFEFGCVGSSCGTTLGGDFGILQYDQYFCAVSGVEGGFSSASTGIRLAPDYESSGEYAIIGSGSSTEQPTLDVYCVPYSYFSPGETTLYNNWSVSATAGSGSSLNMIANNSNNFCYLTGFQGKLGNSLDSSGSINPIPGNPGANYSLGVNAASTVNDTVWGACVHFGGAHTITWFATEGPGGPDASVPLPDTNVAFCAISAIAGGYDYTVSETQPWVGIVIDGNTQTLEVSDSHVSSVEAYVAVSCINYNN